MWGWVKNVKGLNNNNNKKDGHNQQYGHYQRKRGMKGSRRGYEGKTVMKGD